jgi:ribosome-binding protein aMBF1 (putative translation factor)
MKLEERKNLGKMIIGARAFLGLTKVDLAKMAHLGHDSITRAEYGDLAISVNSLSAIQKALEENGIEFLDGARSISLKVREKRGLVGLAIVIDPTMPLGTRFTSVSPSSVS